MTCQIWSHHMTRQLYNEALNGRLLTEINERCNLIAKQSLEAKMKIFEVKGPK